MLTYNDDMVLLVTAANIAGHMEHAKMIIVDNDEELTNDLIHILNDWEMLTRTADDIDEYPSFFGYVQDKLTDYYGVEKEVKT